MARARLTEIALADLAEIHSYIAEDDVSIANNIVDELFEKFEFLAEHPLAGRSRDEIGLHLRSFPHRRYVVFYSQTDFGVEITRVLHSARDIDPLFAQ